MFKLSSDHLANFRGVQSALQTITGWINDIRRRFSNVEERIEILESTPSGGITLPIDAVDVDYDNATSGLTATDVQAAIDELAASGGGGGETVSKSITQVAHGFSVGMPVHLNGSTWEQADRDDATKVCDGIVSAVTDADNFTVAISGWVTATTGEWDAVTGGTGGLTAGDYYWLSSTAGGLTATKPTTGLAQVVLIGVSTTDGIVSIGDVVDMDASSGSFSYFPSGW